MGLVQVVRGDWAPIGAKSADVIHAGKQLEACAAGSVIDIATAGAVADVLCSNGTVRGVQPTFAGDNGWLVAAHNTWTEKVTGDWSKS